MVLSEPEYACLAPESFTVDKRIACGGTTSDHGSSDQVEMVVEAKRVCSTSSSTTLIGESGQV